MEFPNDPWKSEKLVILFDIQSECLLLQKRMGSALSVPGSRAPASARLAYEVRRLAGVVEALLRKRLV